MNKLIIPLMALAVGFGACKGKSNPDMQGTKTDSLTDTLHHVKETTPAGAATTPGATGIGDPSPKSTP